LGENHIGLRKRERATTAANNYWTFGRHLF
jgi:hypothetical protein